MSDKPKNVDEYKTWAESELDIAFDTKCSNHYDSVLNKIKEDILNSAFWRSVNDELSAIDQRYTIDTKYKLLLSTGPLELHKKPFDSFVEKTFRKNVLGNSNWPDPPQGGWILPSTAFSQIRDLIRTTIVVKYLDGVEYLVKEMSDIATANSLDQLKQFEARDEGYYAAHFYTFHNLTIPAIDWDTVPAKISLEIQVTTQLQEVIRRLLHAYYEENRVTSRDTDIPWQWRFRAGEFGTNYMGHILHYLEGMIVEIRERKT